ncbi:MAG TPA: cation diffusion facilitator family transporter [Steroidobacteraceae bacterium]
MPSDLRAPDDSAHSAPHAHSHAQQDAHSGHGADPHDHAGSHSHAGHAHGHAPKSFGTAFAIGTALNLGFVGVEIAYGLFSNSIALVADAGHNLADVLGLLLAWVAAVLARRAPCETYTYGLQRGTILAALANSVLLLLTVGAIAIEAIRRLLHPAPVAGITMIFVAAIGIVINGTTAWLFASGRKRDINLRAAYLHMAYDALVSLGVVVAGAAIVLTGWTRIDPLVSLAVSVVILLGTWALLRDALGMSLDAVPAELKLAEVRAFIAEQAGVTAIHDLHIWAMSTTETALTCHCLMPGGHPGDDSLVRLAQSLNERFGIAHATIQVEVDEHVDCALETHHMS